MSAPAFVWLNPSVVLASVPFNVAADSFVVSGNVSFDDNFAVFEQAPPAAPNYGDGSAATFGDIGAFEFLNGKAILSSTQAGLTTDLAGDSQPAVVANLLTNISPATPTVGLRFSEAWHVSAVFDLSIPLPGALEHVH